MLVWHLASITFLFRWIFRDPKVDVRFLALGAVAPDVIDMAAATILGTQTAEFWGHSLAMPALAGVVVMASIRRGRRRRAWMALVVAWLLHLLVDGMWVYGRVFLWPAFGWELVGQSGGSFWEGAIQRAASDPWRWILEVIGVAYLGWLAYSTGLSQSEGRARLVETGRLGKRTDQG
ncbi:MAG TPA: metal-dependent hydrolase [Acidimicrobiia bacterium]|nr:metal-dependent hydrolase [Acidimicrobiia bacterium]